LNGIFSGVSYILSALKQPNIIRLLAGQNQGMPDGTVHASFNQKKEIQL
jgi:hypothetical protein